MPFDLDKIGQLLKTARVEKGLTFEDVWRALFIRKSTIEAIESGDWQHLPHVDLREGLHHPVCVFSECTRPRQAGADAKGTPGGAAKEARGRRSRQRKGVLLAPAGFEEKNNRRCGHGRHPGRVSHFSERAETGACGPPSASDGAAQPTGGRSGDPDERGLTTGAKRSRRTGRLRTIIRRSRGRTSRRMRTTGAKRRSSSTLRSS